MIEKISSTIAKKICEGLNTDVSESKYEIIEYGIECAINMLTPILFFMLYSVIYKSFLEMEVWLATFLIYRNLIGGYHALSHLKCILLSTLYGLISLYIIPLVSYIPLQYEIISFLLCFVIHIFMNPIIHHEEDRNLIFLKQCRIKILITLLISYLLMVLFNYIMVPISNAIFIGIVSAEFLYLIALPDYCSVSI